MEKLDIKKIIRTDYCFDGTEDLSSFSIILKIDKDQLYFLSADDYSFYKQMASKKLNWKKCLMIKIDDFDMNKIPQKTISNLVVFTSSNDDIMGYVEWEDLFRHVSSGYQELEAFFHTLVDTIENSVSVVDKESKTIVWTKGAEKIFSIPKEEILGKDMKHFFPKEMLLNEETMLSGKSFKNQLHKPREDLFVLINVNPVISNGEIIGAVAAETDVTSQVLMNQELFNASSKIQKLQSKVSKLSNSIDPFQKIKGSSREINNAVSLARKMAKTSENILLLGETGVGKEVFAKAIHNESRSEKPFIALNCGAISPTLFESELFGYEKGSFSGGDPKGKIGKIDLTGEGTLFLDEVGDLPLEQQVKLLRVLENKMYFPVGGLKARSVKCRIIAATNKNLEKLAEQGKFREDLYYRLNTFTIQIPPLRMRRQDILELFHLFLYESSLKYGRQIIYIAPQITQMLLEYEWKGNIRELKSVVDRMVLFSEDGHLVPDSLPEKIAKVESIPVYVSDKDLQNDVDIFEKQKIVEALTKEKGNKTEAAKRLGITRATLYNKMKKLNINL
ncbi:sigma-54 interaction domain-containing protein [Mesobacillus jeotgali]|uniref:sigma-54 interaction domain-containing protein n=1 Tax=Mesobacillus jeotgali TaxID=129985 RepID=UPI0009A6E555|nr:sigma 54-interacting transcriptional regulator [Mesobacillus jeotgali]